MHGLGGLIWIIIVAIAVFSSIRRNVMRARNAQRVQEAPPQAQAYAMPPVLAPSAPVAPVPVASPKIVIAPRAADVTPAPRPMPFPTPAHVRTSPIRGMFGGSATLVRAIVAAEVLGPPKSMQEKTIWSPRHSEPSI